MVNFNLTKMNTSLNSIKLVTSYYSNEIELLKSLIVIDDALGTNKIKFTWSDTLKKSDVSSISFEFEYYNALFNLGMIHFIMSKEASQEGEGNEELSKSIVKGFRYAAYIFEKIRHEASMNIEKELPLDLSFDYMTYCYKISIAYGQMELICFLERKKTSYGMIAKLAKGVCNLFDEIILIASKESNSYFDSIMKKFLENRRVYWEAKMYFFLKEEALAKFNEKGVDYGTALAYQELGLRKMAEYGYKISQFSKYIKVDDYNSLYAKEEALLEDMQNKNHKIYHCVIPKLEASTYEGIIKIEPTIPPELTQSEDLKCLQDMIPKPILEMITKYKENMMDIINQNTNENQNEAKIDYFLKSHGLFDSFAINSFDKISDELWKAISDVQEKGGYSKLVSTIESIRLKSLELEKKLNESLIILQKEKQDDANYSKQFGTNWLREPSPKLNYNTVQQLNKYLSDLLKTREYDNQAKKDITQCSSIFEKLSYTRSIYDEQIPMRNNVIKIAQSKEAQELQKPIDQLRGIRSKIEEVIKCIFDYINGPKIQKQFVDIYNTKQNETNVIQHNKKEITIKFDELKALSKEVNQLEEEILKKKEAFDKVQVKDNVSVANQKEKYKNDLLVDTTLYNKKYLALLKGLNYYTDLENKINLIVNQAHHFVTKRNEEKENLINYITKGIPFPSDQTNESKEGGINHKYSSSEDFLNPQANFYTNMKVKNFNSNNLKY